MHDCNQGNHTCMMPLRVKIHVLSRPDLGGGGGAGVATAFVLHHCLSTPLEQLSCKASTNGGLIT